MLMFRREYLARQRDILLPLIAHLSREYIERLFLLLTGKLDHHREVHARYDLDESRIQKCHSYIGRSAAKHVCKQQYALVLINAGDGAFYLFTRLIDVVVPADRYGGYMIDLADNHLS